jgi:hypothetical protein
MTGREAVIRAIAEAVNAETGFVYLPSDRLLHDMAEEAYKAAEPFLAERVAAAVAAEREAVAALAESVQARYEAPCPDPEHCHEAHYHVRPFAAGTGG